MKSLLLLFLIVAIVEAKSKPKGSREADEFTARQYTAIPPEPVPGPSPGSIYAPGSRLADLGRDLRASQVNDIVSIIVSDSASAISKGTTNSSRKSSVNSNITAAAGLTSVASRLPNLAAATGDQQLAGSGQTSRQTVLTTSLSARVVAVMPNGNLIIDMPKNG